MGEARSYRTTTIRFVGGRGGNVFFSRLLESFAPPPAPGVLGALILLSLERSPVRAVAFASLRPTLYIESRVSQKHSKGVSSPVRFRPSATFGCLGPPSLDLGLEM